MKICRHCKESKAPSDFSSHAKTKDGLQSWCKVCTREKARKSYLRRKA